MKKILSILLVLIISTSSISFMASAEERNIDDICDILNKMGILNGDQNGNYNLQDNLTRSEFTKLAITASVFKDSVPKKSSTSPFSDVRYDYWGTPYIKVGVTNNFVSGYPDSTFRPENPVLLEEGVTITLKLLGYKNEDFMDEWPYAQMGIANNLEMLDGLNATQGSYMQRSDAVLLIYNMLNTKAKGSSADYIESLSYKIIEDVVIVATSEQDKTLENNQINTSSGIFKINDFDSTQIGLKGDALIYQNKDLISYYPHHELKETYVISSVFTDEIIIDKDGRQTPLDIKDDKIGYYNSNKMTYKDIVKLAKAGDNITIIKEDNGEIKNVLVEEEKLSGPYTILGDQWAVGNDTTKIIKNSYSVSKQDIKTHDIIYYSNNLNTIWAYDKKKTGYYEEAKPNKDFPTSIIVSGITYEIEGSTALNKLSTDGSFNYGDAVTLLLGKDGKVADVVQYGASEEKTIGYVINTTKQETIKNDNKYVSYYATAVNKYGETFDYPIKSEGKSYRGKVCEIDFKDGITNLSPVGENQNVKGVFDSSKMMLGGTTVSRNVNIIDTKKIDTSRPSDYVKVYPTRLDKVDIEAKDILYCEKNSFGEITTLFLNDVTGDTYKYGMMIKSESQSLGLSLHGTYTVDISGREQVINTSGTSFTIKSHTPARFDFNGTALESVVALDAINGSITKLNALDLITDTGKKYKVSDKVAVYRVTDDYKYMLINIQDLNLKDDSQNITAFCDNSTESGGMVRVITIKKK